MHIRCTFSTLSKVCNIQRTESILKNVFSIRHRHNAVASGCSAVRQANYLHNLYFIKKCVLPCKNFPMGTKYDRVFSKPY